MNAYITLGLDYVPGTPIASPSDVLWFEFHSPNSDVLPAGPLVAEHVGAVSGSISLLLGPSIFAINFNTDIAADLDTLKFHFETSLDGGWSIQSFASLMPDDLGVAGVWSTPVPATFALLVLGLAGISRVKRPVQPGDVTQQAVEKGISATC
ncbi:MAG: hypothetical protein KDG50_10425 [Chromatiales bacterium]|nr:hypothetical protein [Chromatiales bacterium]